jgi:L-fuconolactonase
MAIDSHQHFWRYQPARDAWITKEMSVLKKDFLPEDLQGELTANDVNGTVAVQASQSEDETLFLLDLATQHDFIRGVVGWVDLRNPRLRERLQFFSGFPKLRGFRHVAQAETDDFLLRPDFQRGIAELRQFGFTFDILIFARQLPAAAEFVASFPKQRFVLDHIAKPDIRSGELSLWERAIRKVAAHASVYCKLSGMVTEADWTKWTPADLKPYLDVAMEAFGPDRLMFGSDWPVCLLAGSYRRVKEVVAEYLAEFPSATQNKIFGENAARFYGLAA